MEFTNSTSANIGSLLKPSYASVPTNSSFISADTPSRNLKQHLRFTCAPDESNCLTIDKTKVSSRSISSRQQRQHLYPQTQISHEGSSQDPDDQQNGMLHEGISGNASSLSLCPFCNSSFQRKTLSRHFLKCKKLKETRRARLSH